MEIEDASDLIFREALKRLDPGRKLDTEALHQKMAEVLQEQGETIFAQLRSRPPG